MNRTSFRRAARPRRSPPLPSRSPPAVPATRRGADAAASRRRRPLRRPRRRRRLLAGGGPERLDHRLPGHNPDVTVTYDPVGSGGGRESFISGAFPLRRLRLLPRRRRGRAQRRQGALRRRGPDRGPHLRQPDRDHLQPRGRRRAQPRRRDHRAGSSTARSPSGTTRPSPTRTPTPTCRTRPSRPVHRSDDSGTTENFTDYLDARPATARGRTRPRTSGRSRVGEAAEGTSGVVVRGQERQGHHRLRRRRARPATSARVGRGGRGVRRPVRRGRRQGRSRSRRGSRAAPTSTWPRPRPRPRTEAGAYPVVLRRT